MIWLGLFLGFCFGAMAAGMLGYAFGQEEERMRLQKLQSKGSWLIMYDDQDVKPEIFTGEGAEAAAKYRFKQISNNWNAHLFVLYESNSLDATLGYVL